MAESTVPLLAAGGIVLADHVLIKGQGVDWKIPIATGLAIGIFALAEPVAPDAVKWLSYLVLVGALLGKDGNSPVIDFETFLTGKGLPSTETPTTPISTAASVGSLQGTVLANVPNGSQSIADLNNRLSGVTK